MQGKVQNTRCSAAYLQCEHNSRAREKHRNVPPKLESQQCCSLQPQINSPFHHTVCHPPCMNLSQQPPQNPSFLLAITSKPYNLLFFIISASSNLLSRTCSMFFGIFYLLYIDMTNHIQNLLLMVLNNLTLVMSQCYFNIEETHIFFLTYFVLIC